MVVLVSMLLLCCLGVNLLCFRCMLPLPHMRVDPTSLLYIVSCSIPHLPVILYVLLAVYILNQLP